MRLREIKGSLFTAELDPDVKTRYVQCISGDLAMGAGIALEFNKRFDTKNRICQHTTPPVQIGACIEANPVICMVTKKHYYKKPTYDTMRLALHVLRARVMKAQIQRLMMPRIGCGLDKLNWDTVREDIEDIFEGILVDIDVYYL